MLWSAEPDGYGDTIRCDRKSALIVKELVIICVENKLWHAKRRINFTFYWLDVKKAFYFCTNKSGWMSDLYGWEVFLLSEFIFSWMITAQRTRCTVQSSLHFTVSDIFILVQSYVYIYKSWNKSKTFNEISQFLFVRNEWCLLDERIGRQNYELMLSLI